MGEGKTHQTNLEREAGLLDLVGEIYQAGLEPERWPATIARMSKAFQADLACIYTPFPARPEQALYLTHNFTGEMETEPLRILRRLHYLRNWSHEQIKQIFPRSPRTRRSHGAGTSQRIPLAVGNG